MTDDRTPIGPPTAPPPDAPAGQPAWRQDFSVDTGQDEYIARRDFTKFMVLTSLAFTVGQVWIGVQSALRRPAATHGPRRIAALSEVPVGGALTFAYPTATDPCILVRTGERQLVAYSQKCTHLSCAVVPEMDKKCFHCPCHEGVFDLATGRPTQGPPRRPLPKVMLEIRGDDIVATGIQEGLG